MQKTTMITKEEMDANRKWYIIDATGLVLGKLSVKLANILRGKDKVTWTPNVDCGDHIIVINANKVVLTGDKLDGEFWYSHSHYMGGLRKRSGREMVNKYPVELITRSVKRMLPKNKLSRQIITKLHVYENDVHNHQAQQPVEIKL